MSMFKIFDVAGSAMSAQTVRLNVTASNLANANSVSGSKDTTYRAREPVFSAMLNEANGGNKDAVGVNIRGIVESKAPLQQVYEPNNPLADSKGYVYMPNVNIVDEMANMISASRSYQTNVQVIDTAKQLMLKTLTMGQ